MFKKLLFVATLAIGLISTQAEASFVATDWKTSGDALATLDTETGMEWLDLTVTKGLSLDAVVDKIASGELSGWRLPTNAEVERLFTNWWPGHNIYNYSTTTVISVSSDFGQKNLAFNAVFGNSSRSANYTRGLYYDENGLLRVAGVYQNTNSYFYGLDNSAVLNSETGYASMSIFLVSDGGTTLSSINDPTLNINNPNAPINMADVPVPAGMAAAGLLILMLGARRKVL